MKKEISREEFYAFCHHYNGGKIIDNGDEFVFSSPHGSRVYEKTERRMNGSYDVTIQHDGYDEFTRIVDDNSYTDVEVEPAQTFEEWWTPPPEGWDDSESENYDPYLGAWGYEDRARRLIAETDALDAKYVHVFTGTYKYFRESFPEQFTKKTIKPREEEEESVVLWTDSKKDDDSW